MIFVTVGTQLAFDRLIDIMDSWAEKHPQESVFAQIGPSKKRPVCMEWKQFLDTKDFETTLRNADLIISHAGMGTILTALQYGKKILVFPRNIDLGEIRNDHQSATVRWISRIKLGVVVAYDEHQLFEYLTTFHSFKTPEKIDDRATDSLIDNLKTFISRKRSTEKPIIVNSILFSKKKESPHHARLRNPAYPPIIPPAVLQNKSDNCDDLVGR